MGRIRASAIFNTEKLLHEGIDYLVEAYPNSSGIFVSKDNLISVVCKTISAVLNDEGPIICDGPDEPVSDKQRLLESIWLDMREVSSSPIAKEELAGFLEWKNAE